MTEHSPEYYVGSLGKPWRCEECGASITHLDAEGKSKAFVACIGLCPEGVKVACAVCGHYSLWPPKAIDET